MMRGKYIDIETVVTCGNIIFVVEQIYLNIGFSTCPGRGVGTGSWLIQFSQFFFSSLKGPSMTLLMSDRLKTHTADISV